MRGSRISQLYGLVVGERTTVPRTAQLAGLVVYGPPATKQVRAGQAFALVPYETEVFAVPRTSQLAGLAVYGTGIPTPTRNRAWTFTLDGHPFYVLDLGKQGTFLYDISSKQWCEFVTAGYGTWNMRNGTMWQNGRIVGGDSLNGFIWEMNPTKTQDEDFRDLEHVVTGGVMLRARIFVAMAALRVAGSLGQLDTADGASISLRFSDDFGNTWSEPRAIPLTKDDFSGEIAWRSLGSFMAPGRIVEISDVGGLLRIDGADWYSNNFDADLPPENAQ